MAIFQTSNLSLMLLVLGTLVNAVTLENGQDVEREPAKRNHGSNGLLIIPSSAPVSPSDESVGQENNFEGKAQHAFIPIPLASTIPSPPASTLQKRESLPTIIARAEADSTTSTSTSASDSTTATSSSISYNCTTTVWLNPTPYQNGPKSTVWISTFTETVYFDCHGCSFTAITVPSTSTHFHRTTTISSVLTQLTPTCYDPPGIAPWLSSKTTTTSSIIYAEETGAMEMRQ